jgi:hypothetical protein
MRNTKLLRGPTVSQWTSSSPSRAATRSITLAIASRSNSVIVTKEKVGKAHFLSKQNIIPFRDLKRQVARCGLPARYLAKPDLGGTENPGG